MVELTDEEIEIYKAYDDEQRKPCLCDHPRSDHTAPLHEDTEEDPHCACSVEGCPCFEWREPPTEEIDHFYTSPEAVCPYCGAEQNDSWEMGGGGEGYLCETCEMEFDVEVDTVAYYTTRKPKRGTS